MIYNLINDSNYFLIIFLKLSSFYHKWKFNQTLQFLHKIQTLPQLKLSLFHGYQFSRDNV